MRNKRITTPDPAHGCSTQKRLRLHRETLRSLTDTEAALVVGGSRKAPCVTSPPFSPLTPLTTEPIGDGPGPYTGTRPR